MLVAGIVLAGCVAAFRAALIPADDTFTYLAAGERLNAGHLLYALSPGDRPVTIVPPYWTSPLLSPPFIAVLWRPLAAVGEAGRLVWWFGAIVATLMVVAFVIIGARPAWLTLVVLVAYGIGELVVVGNVNGFLLVGTMIVWLLRDRPSIGGVLAVMTALKLSPVILLLWLAGQGRLAAIKVFAGALAACALISIIGAGWNSHVEYASQALTILPSRLSLAGLTGIVWLPTAVLVMGTLLTLATRHRPGLSFNLAILTMVFASPIVNPNSFALLIAMAVPSAAARIVARRPLAGTLPQYQGGLAESGITPPA